MQSVYEGRVRRGLTRWELGRIVGRSADAVRDWEVGRRSPSVPTMHLLARTVGVPLATLAAERDRDREFRRREADASDYPAPVEVPTEVAEGTRPGRKHHREYPHQCYAQAGIYVLWHPAAELVHGTIRDGLVPHAWAELMVDGRSAVFDGVTQRFYDAANYYNHFHAHAEVRYSAEQTADHLLAADYWGDWRPTDLLVANGARQ